MALCRLYDRHMHDKLVSLRAPGADNFTRLVWDFDIGPRHDHSVAFFRR